MDLQRLRTPGTGLQEDDQVLPPRNSLSQYRYLSSDRAKGSEGLEDRPEPQEEISVPLKLQFIDKLKLVSPVSMLALVELMQEICPKAFAEQEGKAQILVDLIDPISFGTISK